MILRLLYFKIPWGDEANCLRWLRVMETQAVYEHNWLHRLRKCPLLYGKNINLLWYQTAQPNTDNPLSRKYAFSPFLDFSGTRFFLLLHCYLYSFLFQISLFSSTLKSAQTLASASQLNKNRKTCSRLLSKFLLLTPFFSSHPKYLHKKIAKSRIPPNLLWTLCYHQTEILYFMKKKSLLTTTDSQLHGPYWLHWDDPNLRSTYSLHENRFRVRRIIFSTR